MRIWKKEKVIKIIKKYARACVCQKKVVPLHPNLCAYMKKWIFSAYLIGIACMSIACTKQVEDRPLQAGTVVRDTLNGVPCCVYLPDQYAARTEVFPVLYLQHGMWGNEFDWTTQGRLVPIMDSLLRAGEIREMVVVMPDNCPSRPTSEEEKANASNGQWEANFGIFMKEAESKYRICTDPEQRAIAGLSMGGYHTMRVSYVLEGQFAYVGMFSPATFVHNAPKDAKVFWLGIGTEDFLWDSFQEYRRWLEKEHVEYTYYESTDGHVWPNWQEYLKRFLPKLFNN